MQLRGGPPPRAVHSVGHAQVSVMPLGGWVGGWQGWRLSGCGCLLLPALGALLLPLCSNSGAMQGWVVLKLCHGCLHTITPRAAYLQDQGRAGGVG